LAQKYVKLRQNGRAYYFKGINLCEDQHALLTGCAKVVLHNPIARKRILHENNARANTDRIIVCCIQASVGEMAMRAIPLWVTVQDLTRQWRGIVHMHRAIQARLRTAMPAYIASISTTDRSANLTRMG